MISEEEYSEEEYSEEEYSEEDAEKNVKFFNLVDRDGISYSKFKFSKCFKTNYHSNQVFNLVFFPPSILVSAAIDHRLIITDAKSRECIQVFQDFSEPIRHVIKFTEKSVLVCGDDAFIKGYRMISAKKFENYYSFKMTEDVTRLLKLKENIVLAIVGSSSLQIVNIEKKHVIKKLREESLSIFSHMLLSLKNMNHFYITVDNNGIKKINFETSETIKVYGGEFMTRFIELFLNSDGQEILIAGGDSKVLTFYNTETADAILSISTSNLIRSTKFFERKFLFVGQKSGVFEIFFFGNIHKDTEQPKKILQQLVHNDYIYQIEVLDRTPKFMKLATCSFDFHVNFFTIQFDSRKSDFDEDERIEFSRENYFSGISLNLRNIEFHVGKVFFRL